MNPKLTIKFPGWNIVDVSSGSIGSPSLVRIQIPESAAKAPARETEAALSEFIRLWQPGRTVIDGSLGYDPATRTTTIAISNRDFPSPPTNP